VSGKRIDAWDVRQINDTSIQDVIYGTLRSVGSMNCTGNEIDVSCDEGASTVGDRISKEEQRVREAEEEGRGRELKGEEDACSIAAMARLILYSSLLRGPRVIVE